VKQQYISWDTTRIIRWFGSIIVRSSKPYNKWNHKYSTQIKSKTRGKWSFKFGWKENILYRKTFISKEMFLHNIIFFLSQIRVLVIIIPLENKIEMFLLQKIKSYG
jgi:hypothetical protein